MGWARALDEIPDVDPEDDAAYFRSMIGRHRVWNSKRIARLLRRVRFKIDQRDGYVDIGGEGGP